MKFLATASAFLAATSWAAPLEERQAPTVVSTIDTSLTALAAVLPQYEVAISMFPGPSQCVECCSDTRRRREALG